jgi:hypothetical protein
MVEIMVTHRYRSKTVKMNISENILVHAEDGDDWAIRRIFEIYLELCHYQRVNLQYRSIEFWRVESKTPKQTFAHQTDNLSACERENCSFCDNGQYKKCPNNRHK